ncbi:hypothetical protein D8674_006129 [Pyrus ussuriensis x Pyrus communis]|uniref:Uncharacterized protein n=1 Tax=Pyrus ussuriensis x Pyrus communis TaxID=2448454 RepID=A0A5N5FZ39_9ROSA|nr:hypothetical protein D8674_006129 [Pyrus ussuriensis x Pyrus communis]
MAYLEETLATQYKNWKIDLHVYFKLWDDAEIAHLEGCPVELEDRSEDWEWLYKHFTDPKFVKKFVAVNKAREAKTLLHHSDSKPFSYRLEARRQEGSKFPEIDLFKDVYVPSLEYFGDDLLPYQEKNKLKLDDDSLLPIHHKKEDSEQKHHHNQVLLEIQRTIFKVPQKKPLLSTKVRRYLDSLPP